MVSFKKRSVNLTRQLVALLLTLSWTIGIEAQAATDEERAQQFAMRLKTSMTAIEDSDRDAPRDKWDPAYVVQTVGIEPEKLFAWVASRPRPASNGQPNVSH